MTAPQVVLSPHPDDAVWSAGGRLARWARLGWSVTVVTVFDGDGRALGEWGHPTPPAERRREDAAALAVLGARRLTIGLPEAPRRADRGTPRYGGPLRLFGRAHRADAELPDIVADAVAALLPPGAVVHAPLGAGGHVDHRLVRAAADRLAGRGVPVGHYAEFPYRLRPRDHAGLRPVSDRVDLATWLRAALCYRSQVSAHFGDRDRFEAALLARAGAHAEGSPWRHAERHWSSFPR